MFCPLNCSLKKKREIIIPIPRRRRRSSARERPSLAVPSLQRDSTWSWMASCRRIWMDGGFYGLRQAVTCPQQGTGSPSRHRATLLVLTDQSDYNYILACRVETLPITYLGLPLRFRKARKEKISKTFFDKIRRRLAAWKTHMLTQGGRLILVQSVLSAMTIFHLMSLNPPP